MKKFLFLFSITLSTVCFSQSSKYNVPVTKLTEIMIEKNYSKEDIEELKKYPEKLKTLDYIFSKSFEIPSHIKYSNEQFEKIDVNKYNLTRKLNENVLVFDEESGLSLVLYSLNKMEADKAITLPTKDKISK